MKAAITGKGDSGEYVVFLVTVVVVSTVTGTVVSVLTWVTSETGGMGVAVVKRVPILLIVTTGVIVPLI